MMNLASISQSFQVKRLVACLVPYVWSKLTRELGLLKSKQNITKEHKIYSSLKDIK